MFESRLILLRNDLKRRFVNLVVGRSWEKDTVIYGRLQEILSVEGTVLPKMNRRRVW